jgi:hypothetical protein
MDLLAPNLSDLGRYERQRPGGILKMGLIGLCGRTDTSGALKPSK